MIWRLIFYYWSLFRHLMEIPFSILGFRTNFIKKKQDRFYRILINLSNIGDSNSLDKVLGPGWPY